MEQDQAELKYVEQFSLFWRMVIGLSIVVGLCFTAGQYSNGNAGVMGLIGIIGLILVTTLGFIPAYLLVIGIVALVLFLIVTFFVGKS